MKKNIVQAVRNLDAALGDAAQAVTERVAPALVPAVVCGRALWADTRGDEGNTSTLMRIMFVAIGGLALASLVWAALMGLGNDVAANIRGVSGWSP